MKLPFEGAGNGWTFDLGARSIWNLESREALGFLSTLGGKVRKFTHAPPSSSGAAGQSSHQIQLTSWFPWGYIDPRHKREL